MICRPIIIIIWTVAGLRNGFAIKKFIKSGKVVCFLMKEPCKKNVTLIKKYTIPRNTTNFTKNTAIIFMFSTK